MLQEEDYKLLYSTEGFGGSGHFGIKILVCAWRSATEEERLKNGRQKDINPSLLESIRSAGYKAAQDIEQEILAELAAANPDKLADAAKEKADLLALFPGLIFAKEIPNGYCRMGCCRHLPWFEVTTAIGIFHIGWRKRVINIDWANTVCTKSGMVLFDKEDTTVGDRYIHAYNYDKAREYIKAIFQSVAPSPSLPASKQPEALAEASAKLN